jgi:hypothetical protein
MCAQVVSRTKVRTIRLGPGGPDGHDIDTLAAAGTSTRIILETIRGGL